MNQICAHHGALSIAKWLIFGTNSQLSGNSARWTPAKTSCYRGRPEQKTAGKALFSAHRTAEQRHESGGLDDARVEALGSPRDHVQLLRILGADGDHEPPAERELLAQFRRHGQRRGRGQDAVEWRALGP